MSQRASGKRGRPGPQRTAVSTSGPFQSQPRTTCVALTENGSECQQPLDQPHHELCRGHFVEKRRLYEMYKVAETTYRSLGDLANEQDIAILKQRAQVGNKVVALRDEVHRRFHNVSGQGNRGHIRWILKVKDEVKRLEAEIASREPKSSNDSIERTETQLEIELPAGEETKEQVLVYRSLLSPEFPMSALDHLPRDHPAVILKTEIGRFTEHTITKIYELCPSLNDSKPLIYDPDKKNTRKLDKGDLVMRNILREFLVWTGDTATLARASQQERIDDFLRQSPIDLLEECVKFFQVLGRNDTSHFIRDAICDDLLPEDAPCITILGGKVAVEANRRKMGIEGWDILHQFFSGIATWENLEQFSVNFQDLLVVKKLSALHWYDNHEQRELGWFQPKDDVSQECRMALFLGFVAQTKGFSDPPIIPLRTINGVTTERQSRNYLTGRMSKKDPLAKKLINELSSRVVRFLLFVYDREDNLSGSCIFQRDDEDCWIARSRSASTMEQLKTADWKVEWTLRHILGDLSIIRGHRDRTMARDYYEFIVVDRTPRPSFDMLDCISDALVQISGETDPKKTIENTVRELLPPAEQDGWLNQLNPRTPAYMSLLAQVPDLHYEGSRVRVWDVAFEGPRFFKDQGDRRRTCHPQEHKILSRIVADMEAAGVVVKMDKFERPHTVPLMLQAEDGNQDLYFDYWTFMGEVDEIAAWEGRIRPLTENATLGLDGEGLHRFARFYKAVYPAAVFAKGRIEAHYCAWPIPDVSPPRLGGFNFATPDGRLYKWKALPFDFPLAFQSWQFYLDNQINSKMEHVRATQTTLLICAPSASETESSLESLLAVTTKNNWKVSIPTTHLWTDDLESLNLKVLWKGSRTFPGTEQRGPSPSSSPEPAAATANCVVS